MSERVLFASTIYDMCKQQDCLTPKCGPQLSDHYLIAPAQNGTGFDVTFNDPNFVTKPDEIFYFPSTYKYVSVLENSLDTIISVKSFTQNLFNKNLYDLEIEYRFNYVLEFLDSEFDPLPLYIDGVTIYQVQAYSIYTKKVTLCGEEVKNRVTILDSSTGSSCLTFPDYNIQATDAVIGSEVLPVIALRCNPFVDQNKNELDPNGAFVASITIGLFTIISLYRRTRITVPVIDTTEIPTCDEKTSVCDDFNSIPFPYKSFDA